MRIRSTKPEFWRSKTIAALELETVYDGPLPKRVNELAPASGDHEYVYLFFSAVDELLYVGRSWRPADRFTKHRRKAWWPEVAGVVVVRVAESVRIPGKPGPNTARLEAILISELSPRGNSAPASKAAML